MRIFPPRCMPGSSCSHPEGVGALQVVPHCPTAEMWRTTVGECRLLFASCSKSGKSDVTFFVHSCLIWYICIYIHIFILCSFMLYVYDCIPHCQLKTPRMRHEPWVFFWQAPAKQMILASLGVAMRTRPFGRSQVIVFELSPYSLKACKSFF